MCKKAILLVSYVILLTGIVGSVFADPNASNPSPASGTTNMPLFPMVTLTWTPGDYVGAYTTGQNGNGHHVFFNTDSASLYPATGAGTRYALGTRYGHYRATSAFFDPNHCIIGYSGSTPVYGQTGYGNPLTEGKTFYWSVLEVDSAHPSGLKGPVWSFATIGEKATNPSPASGAIVGLSVNLSWTAGPHASNINGQDVYLGTSLTTVTNATTADMTGTYKGRQTSTSYAANGLAAGFTYYWRIDEVNGATIWKGNVWNFKTDSGLAKNPSPANDAVNVGVNTLLTWTKGFAAVSHDVYFGTNEAEVSNMNSGDPDPNNVHKGLRSEPNYTPATLVLDTVYYWRVDEINDAYPQSPWRGDTWHFRTDTGRAINPTPVNGATMVWPNTNLIWTAGSVATSHDIYFGTSSPPPFKVNQTGTTFEHDKMNYNTTYYWRIDERSASDTITGDVWHFKIMPPPATHPGKIGVGVSMGQSLAFVDAAKNLRPWEAISGGTLPVSSLDANGYPMCDAQTCFFDHRPATEWNGEDQIDDPCKFQIDVSGTYKLSFTGQASLSAYWSFTISNKIYNSSTNTTTADVVVPAGTALVGVGFTNTRRTPSSALNTGITNVKLIRPGYPANTTQVFHTPFIQTLTYRPFSTMRMAGWTLGDGEPTYPAVTNWSDRKLPTDTTQDPWGNKKAGGAWEYVIQLANQVNKDIWINIPVSATTDYVTQLATMLKNNLDPGLNIYIESSNEVWNPIFNQYNWNSAQATALGITPSHNHARRIVEICNIFKNVFGPAEINRRIRVVMCWWEIVSYQYDDMLTYIHNNYGEPNTLIYAIAGAPYFNASSASSTATPEQIITAMWQSSDSSKPDRVSLQAVANKWGLKNCTYEGGSDTGGGSTTNVGNRIMAERSAGMDDLMIHDLADNWFPLGGDLFMYLELCSGYNRYGSWGLTEDITNPNKDHKFEAISDLLFMPDFYGDNVINYRDLREMANEWLHTGEDLLTDLNEDGTVDFKDFAEFAKWWLVAPGPD